MDSRWKTQVEERVREIVGFCFPDSPLVDSFASQEHLQTWYKALVFETYDINNNYEALEYLGDRILKSVFAAVMFELHPELTNSQMSNLDMFFMSKSRQGDMATDTLQLTPLILTSSNLPDAPPDLAPEDTSKLAVDVFESFFGALWLVGDRVAFGLGYVACYNLLKILLADEEIQDEINGDRKTRVTQRLQQSSIPPLSVREKEQSLGVYQVELFFPSNSIASARRQGLTLPSSIMRGGPDNKRRATEQAYSEALAVLDHAGLSAERAAEISRRNQFEKIDSRLVADAEDLARAAGYPRLSFLSPKKADTKDYYVLLLVGETEGRNSRKILASSRVQKGDADLHEARARLLAKYVSSAPRAPEKYSSRSSRRRH